MTHTGHALFCAVSGEPSPRMDVMFMIVLNWWEVSPSYRLCMYYFPSIYFLSLLSEWCHHFNLPLTITYILLMRRGWVNTYFFYNWRVTIRCPTQDLLFFSGGGGGAGVLPLCRGYSRCILSPANNAISTKWEVVVKSGLVL